MYLQQNLYTVAFFFFFLFKCKEPCGMEYIPTFTTSSSAAKPRITGFYQPLEKLLPMACDSSKKRQVDAQRAMPPSTMKRSFAKPS